jgi:hypothetical protein
MNRVDTRTPADLRAASPESPQLEATRLIAELHARDALKTQFLSNISHDLRTPLTAMITHAEIMRDGILGDLNARQQESIGSIIGGGRQLLAMVGEILTYARGAANQLALTMSETSLAAVVEQAHALNASLAAKKEVVLELDVPADLPDDVTARLQAMARAAWDALDCEGLARGDFFVGADGVLTVNEVNTMPGFTPTSMFPRMWAASGVGQSGLHSRAVIQTRPPSGVKWIALPTRFPTMCATFSRSANTGSRSAGTDVTRRNPFLLTSDSLSARSWVNTSSRSKRDGEMDS